MGTFKCCGVWGGEPWAMSAVYCSPREPDAIPQLQLSTVYCPPGNPMPFHNYSCPLHLTNLYCQVIWTAGLAQHTDTPGERIMEHLSEDENQNTVKCSVFRLPLHLGFVRNGDLRKNLNQSVSDPLFRNEKKKKSINVQQYC